MANGKDVAKQLRGGKRGGTKRKFTKVVNTKPKGKFEDWEEFVYEVTNANDTWPKRKWVNRKTGEESQIHPADAAGRRPCHASPGIDARSRTFQRNGRASRTA